MTIQFDTTLSVSERAANALALSRAGENERVAFASIMRTAIEGRDDAFILALRNAKEAACKSSRDADVWIRGTLAGAVRGKEFQHLPKLTVKADKVMPGVVNRYVTEKESKETPDSQKQQDAIAKAINIIRATKQLLESGELELSEENMDAFRAMARELRMMDVSILEAEAEAEAVEEAA